MEKNIKSKYPKSKKGKPYVVNKPTPKKTGRFTKLVYLWKKLTNR